MTEINLWLDSYDDMYSDFDSRQFEKRRISEDFLYELRTEMKYKKIPPGNMILFLPREQRKETTESIITSSLYSFFNNRFQYYKNKSRAKLNNGLLLFVSGALMMLAATWVSFWSDASWSVILLKVILEPAGWFLIWAAFDFLFYDLALLKKEKKFFRYLSQIQVYFKSS